MRHNRVRKAQAAAKSAEEQKIKQLLEQTEELDRIRMPGPVKLDAGTTGVEDRGHPLNVSSPLHHGYPQAHPGQFETSIPRKGGDAFDRVMSARKLSVEASTGIKPDDADPVRPGSLLSERQFRKATYGWHFDGSGWSKDPPIRRRQRDPWDATGISAC